MIDRWRALNDALQEWHFLEECLLHDVRPTRFGFGVSLVFNYVWNADHRIRTDALERPVLLIITLLGVESIRFVGALTPAMKAHPEQINWGLSEVARVEPRAAPSGLGLSVLWQGDRRLDIEFMDFELHPTP